MNLKWLIRDEEVITKEIFKYNFCWIGQRMGKWNKLEWKNGTNLYGYFGFAFAVRHLQENKNGFN